MRWLPWVAGCGLLLWFVGPSLTQSKDKDAPRKDPPSIGKTSYDQISPVILGEKTFEKMMAEDKANKAGVMAKHSKLMEERYDLSVKVDKNVTMSRGKPIPVGPTAKLASGVTWEKLAALSPEEVKAKDLFPKGYLPLPHPNHDAGGMLFSQRQVKETERLARFDLDFDIPDHFLPEFPPPIFLTTRPDLGDVSQGKLVDISNFQQLFQGILNSKDLEGFRLLVTQFPQQQFNATADRKVEKPSLGVACFDCHLNGHTSAATHLLGDIRPQANRIRIDTPTLRGVNIQRLFGSKRALKTIEDFTEFEQRAAYFDGDPVSATIKGVNPLERGSQVHFMAEMQNLLDFPPAPNLGLDGKLNPKKFKPDAPEMLGQKLFFGKARCAECHPAPYYTDNLMHNLQAERFYDPRMINGMLAGHDGPIKTFPLRGIKDSPPYLHDGRLLTLEDTVEFFNLILETQLTGEEKKQLVAFMRQL
ncbi:MAG: cytochrome B6 [Planctomycetia bacterium]|nr:cytochrome B6 [Planctomycetia bacterium]